MKHDLRPRRGALGDLKRWVGGSTPERKTIPQLKKLIRRIVSELEENDEESRVAPKLASLGDLFRAVAEVRREQREQARRQEDAQVKQAIQQAKHKKTPAPKPAKKASPHAKSGGVLKGKVKKAFNGLGNMLGLAD